MTNVIKLVHSKKNATKTAAELFTVPNSIQPVDFILNSFYLPVDILTDGSFKVEPIKVCSGAEFEQFWISRESVKWLVVTEGASDAMLFSAKQLGVSCRLIKATNEQVMIVKLWYGDNK